MIKKQNIKKNFIYQLLYQVLMLIVPLIISPYLTRVLGDKALGVYTYVNSIAYYFVLAANLGIAKYGQRAIAECCGDENKTRKVFWSLFSLHLFFSLISFFIYVFAIAIFVVENTNIYWIEALYVASALFDITWLFYGLENFKNVVIRNAIIKIAECVLIFFLVSSPSDLWKYTLITAGGLLLGQIILLPQAIKILKPVRVSFDDVKAHVKPLFVFAISVFAISLYTVFDKTLLGLMSAKENVAYYEYANRIIALPKTFISIIGTVMFPRACVMAAKGNRIEQQKYLKVSLMFVAFIGFASLFGLLGVANEFSVIYYGEEFSKSGNVMIAMCALPIIVGLGDIVRTQYMIPNHMDKYYIYCIILNAIINLILTTLFIPILGVYGAVLGTFAAELLGCITQTFICRRFISMKQIIHVFLPFAVIGAVMYCALLGLNELFSMSIMHFITKIIIGAVIYTLLSIVYISLSENRWMINNIMKMLPTRKRK